ncbi:DNA polymerase IV [Alkalicoccobacillus plakortidis]|uniref:DNA polymerase IV n=1 Tax=Alkalicoccobacillus plakortidis TaxID=444060 RepID=A0ABT0XPD9_9BACI|nr:DNA polymerase IV [Alkalicoccobacillus plakortidis]MCM2677765.1 DNA polymerase IV [Alkalicoccobacillus plakortidis]
MRILFHVDMNSFFASVELSFRPELKGKPVAVAGSVEDRRGIIVTSTYEARARGVKTAMPVWQAKKACPELILLKSNFERYRTASRNMFEILRSYTSLVEPVSIDEGYMDVTQYHEQIHPYKLAQQIQETLIRDMNLPCSIGIAPNKFLAKMASDMKKPNGITILRKRELPELLWPLPISEMQGIGKKTVGKWEKAEILTIGDLANADPHFITEKFGSIAHKLQKRAQGIDDRPVNPDSVHEFKSIGNSTTLPRDTKNEQKIETILKQLADSVSYRLNKKEVVAYGIQLTIKYHDWKITNKSEKLSNACHTSNDIYQRARTLFKKSWNTEPIRLLGISTYDLVDKRHAYKQLNLFSQEKDVKDYHIDQTMLTIQERFGQHALVKGAKGYEARRKWIEQRSLRGTSLEKPEDQKPNR